MKKFKLLFLTTSLLSMVVTACNFTPDIPKENETSDHLSDEEMIDVLKGWNPNVTVQYDQDFVPVFDEDDFEPIPEDKQARLSSTILDAKRDSSVGVVFKDAQAQADNLHINNSLSRRYEKIARSNRPENYVSVTDVNKNNQDVLFSAENNRLSLKLDSSFKYGMIYFVYLNDDTLMFENKDPSIRRLTIEIEDDPSEPEEIDEYELQDNIPVLSLAHVSNEDVDDNAIFSFDYDATLPDLNVDDVFLVKQDESNDGITLIDFYGQYIRKELNPDGSYKVFYKEPESERVYKKLRRKSVKLIDFTNVHILVNEDTLRNQLRYSNTSRALLSFFAKESHSKDPEYLRSILDNIGFDFKFNYYDGKFTFSFAIYASNIKICQDKEGKSGLFLTLKYQYTRISEYHIDFDVGVKTKWGVIPVGVAYKIKMVEDIEESHSFFVIIDSKSIDDESEDKIKSDLIEEVGKAKEGEDNFYKQLSEDDEAKEQTEGNKTTIPLFEIEVPVYEPLMFKFEMDLIIDLTVEAMFLVKKQWKSNRVVLNFSNEDGGDSDTHQDVKESSAWDFYFMGLAELRIAFRLSGALYIAGTYKYLHVELYAEFYVKIGIQGNLSITILTDTSGEQVTGNASIDLYVLMGAKVGIDIVVAIFDLDFSVDLFKTYILRVHYSNDLQRYSDSAVTEITLEKTIANINDYDILKFVTWDGVKMSVSTQKFDADSEVSLIESWLGDLSFRMFSFESNDERISIADNGEISVADKTAAVFDATFTVKVSPLAGFIEDREITIHFIAPDAHHIYLHVDQDTTIDLCLIRPEVEYTLELPPERPGYRFVSYIVHYPDGDQEMHPTQQVAIPESLDDDLHIDINWYKIKYYTVYFFDGHNNLIYVDSHVEEHTASSEPDPEIRDQYMDGYFFIGWDKSFDHVDSDLIVRGIYLKVGD